MARHFTSKKQLKWIPVWYLGIIIITSFPLLIAWLGDFIGRQAGCKVNEAFTDDCVWHGLHIGQTLSNMFTAGWLMLITIPIGFIAFIAMTIISIRDIAYYNRSNN